MTCRNAAFKVFKEICIRPRYPLLNTHDLSRQISRSFTCITASKCTSHLHGLCLLLPSQKARIIKSEIDRTRIQINHKRAIVTIAGFRIFDIKHCQRRSISAAVAANLAEQRNHLQPGVTKVLLGKPRTSEMLLRCTIFDKQGKIKTMSGEFRKADFCSHHGLLPRDLRNIDASLKNVVPQILIRKEAIIVQMLHIRALIKADEIILFDVYGSTDTYTQSVFLYDLQGKLQMKPNDAKQAYEFRALEATLISVLSALHGEAEGLMSMVSKLLHQFEDNIDRARLRLLLQYSKKLSLFQKKATLVREAIAELLDQDDDLANMYLTDKKNGKLHNLDEHEEIEMLLESYFKQVDEIVQMADDMSANVRSTEEVINIILDANRNALMVMELQVSLMAVALATSAFIAGLFGMNLRNDMENDPYAFVFVTMFATSLGVVILSAGLFKLRKAGRMVLYGAQHQ